MLKDNQTTSPCIVAQNITEKKNSEMKNKKLFITTKFFFFFYTHQDDINYIKQMNTNGVILSLKVFQGLN